MQEFNIHPVSTSLDEAIQTKINFKTKPLGSLGLLEELAFKVARIQQTLTPQLNKPAILVCAGDHGVTEEKISPFPQEVTFQMVMNFLGGGAAINVFCKQHDIHLVVADTGVNFDFETSANLLNLKVAKGTKNFTKQPAMTIEQCEKAMSNGAAAINDLYLKGTNIVGFGEMGIGNTTSAAALLCALTQLTPEMAAGSGTGLDEAGIKHKAGVIQKALDFHGPQSSPQSILACYGGFEIATICGAMLKAAELGMIILCDGFIVTAALMVAHSIEPNILDYTIFSHQSNEKGHQHMLKHLYAKPLLNIGMRLGEGSGVAVAYPLIQSAVNFLNEMSSFEDAGVSNKK